MDLLALPLLAYYAAAIAVFCVYGVHRYLLVLAFRRRGGLRALRGDDAPAAVRGDDVPRVTVQLPMFNEAAVAERVIEAACGLDWPQDRLQVQVLDDSTDECAAITRRVCRRLAAHGHDVELVHRTDRTGYKAGALAAGLGAGPGVGPADGPVDNLVDGLAASPGGDAGRGSGGPGGKDGKDRPRPARATAAATATATATATGEYIAIFDADFVPAPNFLRRAMASFDDDRVGLVQARWSYLNRDASLLTRIQAMSLDGHFVVEQTARALGGHWFNFNGTAGIWRRACIDDAGGWAHDTLTEDTDLSYRAQLRGWRFVYRPDITVPCELPPNMRALASQQHRWTKGLIQNAIKLLPTVMRAPAPLATRLEAAAHLTAPLPYAAMFLFTLLAAAAFVVGPPLTGMPLGPALAAGVLCLVLGSCAAGTFMVVGSMAVGSVAGNMSAADVAEDGERLPRRRGNRAATLRALLRVPALMAIGVGLSLRNTAGIVEACAGRRTAFVRTPKFARQSWSAADPAGRAGPGGRGIPDGSAEVVLGVVMVACVGLAWTELFSLVGVPFLALFACGYLGVGLPQLIAHARAGRRSTADTVGVAGHDDSATVAAAVSSSALSNTGTSAGSGTDSSRSSSAGRAASRDGSPHEELAPGTGLPDGVNRSA